MKTKLSFIVLIAIVFGSISISAQSLYEQAGASRYYLEINDLTVENYPRLHLFFKNNNGFELVESCIPAHIISVKSKNGAILNTENFTGFSSELKTVTGLQNIALLENYNNDQFMGRCLSARSGN